MRNIKEKIDCLREKLNKLLEEKDKNIEEILRVSQELDLLILKYYTNNGDINTLPNDNKNSAK